MTKLTVYAKLVALAVLTRLPDPVASAIVRPFSRWLWPTHPSAKAAFRKYIGISFDQERAESALKRLRPTGASVAEKPKPAAGEC